MTERAGPNRVSRMLMAAAALSLLVLFGSCGGAAAAARTGALPAFDWQIPLGQFRVLAVHNGPLVACHPRSLHDSCHPQIGRHEFSVSYISPTAARTLVSFDMTEMR